MSSPPRILVLFGNVPLYGQERGNIEALDALRSTGCGVLFLIREEWTRDTIQTELNRRGLKFVFVPYFDTVRRGVSLRVWWNNLKGIVGGSWQLLKLIRSFKATHIHAGSTANVLNFLPALMLTRLPLVYRAGDIPPRHHWLWRMVWWFTRWRAAHFVCISRFIREAVVAAGVPEDRTSILYNVPPARARREQPSTFERGSAGHTFVYMGQISPEKGLAELVQAAIAHCRNYPAARFLLAGEYGWNNEFAAGLQKQVSLSDHFDAIRFVGYVSDIDGLLAAADVHVCPSICDEALGNVVLESKQAGLPSVIFPSGGLPELMTHGVDGYVCREKTTTALAEAFEAYERDPTLAPRQGAAAKASLVRFEQTRFAEKWRFAYECVRRPRILVLFGNVPLYGQERGNIEALDALRRMGCEVLFLIREEWTKDTIQAELNRRGLKFVIVSYFDTFRHGVNLRVWWNNLNGIVGGSWQLLKLIRSYGATHIHAGSTANVLNFLPALMLSRLPLVFRAGDIPPRHHWLWRMVWRYTSGRAAHFVCDSRFIQAKLVALGVKNDRTTVIYAPGPRRVESGATVAPLLPSRAGKKLFTVLYVGQISQEKGVGLLVEAAISLSRERSDIRFLLAGEYAWNNPFAREQMACVARAGLQDRIVFTGFVEDIDVLYDQADLHVCPSLCDESYGLTVVEAKERRLPSLVFASGGLTELVEQGAGGWVCEEKTAAVLERAIAYCAEHTGDVAKQGQAAHDSLSGLGMSRFEERWNEVYARAAE